MSKRLVLLCMISMAVALAPLAIDHGAAATTKKKKATHKRSDYTPEQRAKLMEEARKICKKSYGATSTVYKIDYYHWKVICNAP